MLKSDMKFGKEFFSDTYDPVDLAIVNNKVH